MWLVAVGKTTMQLEHNLSFVFLPIPMKQFCHTKPRASTGIELALKMRKTTLVFICLAGQKYCWQRSGLVIV